MSSYGFRCFNPTTGVVQIDDTFKNLSMALKQTLTITPTPSGLPGANPGSYYSLAINGIADQILAIGECTSAISYNCQSRSGNDRVWNLVFNTQGTVTFTYYVFTPTPDSIIGGSHYGLRIFDSSGNLTFHSDYKYMRILDIYPMTSNAVTPPVASYSLPSGRTFAYMLEVSRGSSSSAGIISTIINAANIDSGVLTTRYIRNSVGLLVPAKDGSVTVVDVTDF